VRSLGETDAARRSRALPAPVVLTDAQADAGRARASSAPVAGWSKVEGPPCRGLATTSSEDALTGEPRGALSLRSHRVRAVIAGGLSRSEVVEELVNEAPRAVGARFSFVLPGGASVSGVSLLRGKTWLEAEIVDSDRIAAIPRGRGIVPFARDDSDAFVARMIGFAPKQRRSLRLAYNGTVERSASHEIYRYPISLSPCASALPPEVSIEVVLAGDPVSPFSPAPPTSGRSSAGAGSCPQINDFLDSDLNPTPPKF
jgi:hypothetical protein